MTEVLHSLIDALREELQHYGEMLALLDQQQEMAIARRTDDMYAATLAIQNHSAIMQAARQEREDRQRVLARELCVLESSTFVEMIPLLPAPFRPLVQSLVEENNDLLQKVQRRARQNHLVLSRSVELMQQFIGTLIPSRSTGSYNDRGGKLSQSLSIPPLYEAVG